MFCPFGVAGCNCWCIRQISTEQPYPLWNFTMSKFLEPEPITGVAEGARYLISYELKESKDPVVFIKNKKDLMVELQRLLKDSRVDQDTLLVSQITSQFKPKLVTKRVRVFQTEEHVELYKQ